MSASHYSLDNLVAFLDHNGLQIDGACSDVMSVEPVVEKWQAFGWHVLEIDGHDMEQIAAALDTAREIKGKPVMIVARTVKGKGVSFMEDQVNWHGVCPGPEDLSRALTELDAKKGVK